MVDDDRDIHALTSIILNDFQFQNKPLRIHYARTSEQALECIAQNPNIQLMLIDMVMEDKDSGMKIIQHLRDDLKNERAQIVVRTSVREMLPQQSFVEDYNILTCKIKSEMTAHVFREIILHALESWLAAGKQDVFDKDFVIKGLNALSKTPLNENQKGIIKDLLSYLG